MRASIDTDPRWDAPAGEVDESPDAPSLTVADEVDSASMRTWVVRGMAPAVPDPRRRRGGHANARQLLATDHRWLASPVGLWQDLVGALHRQTAHAALARLDESDRKILMMAYLQGRTNGEIAALLQVSLSTVGRRLSKALSRLEDALGRAGTWTSTMVLLLLAFLARRGGVERVMTYRNAASIAVGAAATLTVAVLVTGPAPAVPAGAPPSRPGVALNFAAPPVASLGNEPATSAAITVASTIVLPAVAQGATGHTSIVTGGGQPPATHPGCAGNPTSAAPPTPVGSPGHHPTGPPVTHPGPGVCGPHR